VSFDQPIKLPLVTQLTNRDETLLKDARLVNALAEPSDDGKGFEIRKRFGFSLAATPNANTSGQGQFGWKGNNYSVFGGAFYQNTTQIATGLDTTNGVYRFQIVGNNPGYLVLGNGVKAYWYNGTTFAQITDANFPASFVKGFAYLDSYLYVMDGHGQIWEATNQNDPRTWSATDMIVAQIEPDAGIALAKQINYIIALKAWTTEVFYDAGNASGSSLGSIPGSKQPFGCASADLVQQMNDMLIWVTQDQSETYQVALMQNLQANIVSTPAVERLLQYASFTGCYSLLLKHAGHNVYVITLPAMNLTLAYDIPYNLWHVWTDANGNYWPFCAASYLNGYRYIQSPTTGSFYAFDMDYVYSSDNGVLVPTDIYTPNFDAGTDRKKTISLMRFDADRKNGSMLYHRNSDDDYQTWTGMRRIDLSADLPILTNMGEFRRRAWHFRHMANTPLRLRSVYLQMALGTA
jgi:hypothetical protein